MKKMQKKDLKLTLAEIVVKNDTPIKEVTEYDFFLKKEKENRTLDRIEPEK